MKIHNRIIRDSEILRGRLIIKGTRIPVYLITDLYISGLSMDEICEEYPQLSKRDVEEALRYAGIFID